MDNLNRVAEVCKTAGASEVLILSKDLAITEECISAVEDTVDHFKGMYYRWCKTYPHPCISIAFNPCNDINFVIFHFATNERARLIFQVCGQMEHCA